ncbi:MAG: hypothetical protein ACOCRO_10815 [Halanaerobiales bacterium]
MKKFNLFEQIRAKDGSKLEGIFTVKRYSIAYDDVLYLMEVEGCYNEKEFEKVEEEEDV